MFNQENLVNPENYGSDNKSIESIDKILFSLARALKLSYFDFSGEGFNLVHL